MKMNREILRIALPAIIANVTVPLLGLADTAIAGHLSSTQGAAYIGAISVGAMMFNLIYWNFGFLRMGTSGMTAQAYGAGDVAEQARLLRSSCGLALLISLVIVVLQWPLQWLALWAIGPSAEVRDLALSYFYIGIWGAPPIFIMMSLKGWLLGMQNSTYPMAISIGVNVLNIVVSVIAVYLLGAGFKGIAIGTVVAEYVGLAISVWMVWHKYRDIVRRIRWRKLFDFTGAGKFMRVNADIFVRSFVLMLVTLFFISAGARSGDMILAVNALMMQLFTLYSHFIDGVAFAGEALVGKYYGAGNVRRMNLCVRRLFAWGSVVMLAFAVAYALFPEPIYSLLTSDAGVVRAAMDYRWWCVAIPVAGMAAFVWDGVYIGLTASRAMMVAVLAAGATFWLSFFALPADWGNDRLWLAFVLYLVMRGVILTACYRHYGQEKMKNLR